MASRRGTNGDFILSGVGGTNSGTYYVLTSTNLAMPLAHWTPVATNQFGSQGQFIFTNTRANQRAATVLHPANCHDLTGHRVCTRQFSVGVRRKFCFPIPMKMFCE